MYKDKWPWPRLALLIVVGREEEVGSQHQHCYHHHHQHQPTLLDISAAPASVSQGAWLLEFVNFDIDTFKML